MRTWGAVYGVHSVRAEEISATELVCSEQPTAEKYAQQVSTDPGVLAAAVTRYQIDEPGRRTAIALYVEGKRQEVPYVSDDRQLYANGWAKRRPESIAVAPDCADARLLMNSANLPHAT